MVSWSGVFCLELISHFWMEMLLGPFLWYLYFAREYVLLFVTLDGHYGNRCVQKGHPTLCTHTNYIQNLIVYVFFTAYWYCKNIIIIMFVALDWYKGNDCVPKRRPTFCTHTNCIQNILVSTCNLGTCCIPDQPRLSRVCAILI